ncbi:MAG: N-acetylmuramoyl-L-alanine amidase [Candidatus Rokubacteria bacterium]|nr:N-acetylmuramoyl-L-alanine amidase [Candidatus Rokubacteria bacterium]
MKVPRLLLLLALLAVFVGVATAADVPIIVHDRHPYVELARLGAELKARTDARPGAVNAELRTGGRVVRFTRNWRRILVDGTPVVLDAPVRVKNGRWIVPRSFVTEVLPRLTAAAPAAVSPAPPAAMAREAAASPSGASLEEMRVRSYPSFTRVVLETSAAVPHKLEATEGGTTRVRVVGLSGRPRSEDVKDGFVDIVRLGRVGGDALLLVTFAGEPGALRASTLSDPPRLVLDFMKPNEAPPRESVQAGPLRTIVLDAGHGGHDPGATGPGGLTEKELVLDVTKRVARLVEDKLDIKVRLSRDGDHFVPLKERTSFANRERADLFVSIHANAHASASHEGVETYFLSSEATDIAARQTAALENSVVQLEKPVNGRAAGRENALKAILWDLAQSEFLFESSLLAEVVQDSMTRSLRIPNRGVKQAGFYVLGGAAMPAILIEIGFVTNPREERRLRDSKYRDEIARAIFAGIADYKKQWDQRMRASAEKSK